MLFIKSVFSDELIWEDQLFVSWTIASLLTWQIGFCEVAVMFLSEM